ncbi:MBL fold metallo-hydrolase [Silvimonas sp.]|uniref:MBL fold metallo-hydrolase n=1 Tax=Silvimonas sp. TaxID=2650811 RepID=UPI0028422C2D|nr:MBL fold metallo-hydrolase [Silvimonas sp.]MDR3430087.1 MBL fold metallo-hydrolase [Silvimonas sp.]
MNAVVEATLLGVGSSGGSPALGCQCATCTSTDPKNRRTRASAIIKAGGLTFLIDTGPDLRQQVLREGLLHIDAVLYTHPHADHLHGIDDLRAFCWLNRAAIPVYGNTLMAEHIKSRFSYTLLAPGEYWDKPVLTLTEIDDQPFKIKDVTITPIPLMHGKWPILGYRIGNVAYLTDVSLIPEESYERLANLDVLFLDCLRPIPHPTHFGVDQALEAAQRIKARRTVLIHMTHELEFHALSARLPDGIEVGYDGLHVIAER